MFEFIAHRYESGSLIITSNQLFSEGDQIFPDSMMTVAAVDRVIHHTHILEIEGESYRKKQHLKKQESLIQPDNLIVVKTDKIVDARHTKLNRWMF